MTISLHKKKSFFEQAMQENYYKFKNDFSFIQGFATPTHLTIAYHQTFFEGNSKEQNDFSQFGDFLKSISPSVTMVSLNRSLPIALHQPPIPMPAINFATDSRNPFQAMREHIRMSFEAMTPGQMVMGSLWGNICIQSRYI